MVLIIKIYYIEFLWIIFIWFLFVFVLNVVSLKLWFVLNMLNGFFSFLDYKNKLEKNVIVEFLYKLKEEVWNKKMIVVKVKWNWVKIGLEYFEEYLLEFLFKDVLSVVDCIFFWDMFGSNCWVGKYLWLMLEWKEWFIFIV